MTIPTEPIGSIPRPPELIQAAREAQQGRLDPERLDELYRKALVDTIQRFEATGSPVITDGEQRWPAASSASEAAVARLILTRREDDCVANH